MEIIQLKSKKQEILAKIKKNIDFYDKNII